MCRNFFIATIIFVSMGFTPAYAQDVFSSEFLRVNKDRLPLAAENSVVTNIVTKTAGDSFADVFADDASVAKEEVISDAELLAHPELLVEEKVTEPLVVISPEEKQIEAPVVAPAVVVRQESEKRLVLAADGVKLRIEPSILEAIAVGESIHVSLAAPINPNIFVRDASVVSWHPKSAELVGVREGETELYVVHAGNMSIVKLRVGKAAAPVVANVPENLVAIVSMVPEKEKLSSAPMQAAPQGPFRPALSITASAQQARDTLQKVRDQQAYYRFEQQDVVYQNLAIQVIDERSVPEAGIVYPVQGAEVRIVGAEFSFVSDATGIVRFKDIPAGSRLLVVVFDREGRISPTIQEVQTQKDLREDTQRVKILQRSSFDVYSRAFQVVQDAGLSSMCGRLVAPQGQARDFTGLRVLLNNAAEGAYYFNRYGPDPIGREMDASGQFCFFNINPGITEMQILEGNEMVGAFPITFISGTHLQEDFEVENTPMLRTHLAVAASGLDQVFQEGERASRLSPVDDAEILVVGENEPMRNIGRTILEVAAKKTAHKDRLYGLVQGAEFETALFPYQTDDTALPITPLVPRGFVQDVFNELYQQDNSTSFAFDPSLGALLVQFGHPYALSSRDVSIRVLNPQSQEVQTGWYFGAESGTQTKSIYFNMEPGIYTVIAEDKNGQWLDVSTMPVDYWTLSVARLGAIMHYDPSKIAQDPSH